MFLCSIFPTAYNVVKTNIVLNEKLFCHSIFLLNTYFLWGRNYLANVWIVTVKITIFCKKFVQNFSLWSNYFLVFQPSKIISHTPVTLFNVCFNACSILIKIETTLFVSCKERRTELYIICKPSAIILFYA